MASVIEWVSAGGDMTPAIVALDADPQRQTVDLDALKRWMQGLADRVIVDLAEAHSTCSSPCVGSSTESRRPETAAIARRPAKISAGRPDVVAVARGSGVVHHRRDRTAAFREGVPGHQFAVSATRTNAADRNLVSVASYAGCLGTVRAGPVRRATDGARLSPRPG